ncbi:OmpA family protein [Oxynema sp. CENA135]|uniref:OmpA family protein n=1 Tax=Oxynema sp. CENA135 TaxID=984206 RepID=UPI0019098C7A|nr:OmpA family protein [Oxynema sp. CENA135]MBK4731716.1 OmpA family protein [Oxynema sp. CENA135]
MGVITSKSEVAIAPILIVILTACQFPSKNYPEVTTLTSIPISPSRVEVEPLTTQTSTFIVENPNSTSTTAIVETNNSQTNITSSNTSTITAETSPETTTEIEVEPEPATPTPIPPTNPTNPGNLIVETIVPTTPEVEQTLTELEAETTLEGIKFNLPDNVLFDFDKYNVRADAKPLLTKIDRLLTYFDNPAVVIYGHTDNKGEEDYNQELSEKRAAAVKYYFVNVFNREPTRIQTQGFGEAKPIAPNQKSDGTDNPEGRQQNRRVEFIIQTETRTIRSSPENAFREGVNAATRASVLTQEAKTPEQWQAVAAKWEQAIQLMQVVPESSSDYARAQAKVKEYQNNLNYAEQNAANLGD